MTNQTATEFMPVMIDTGQAFISALSGAEVFDGISYLQMIVGLFALSIILDFIYWLRSRGDE